MDDDTRRESSLEELSYSHEANPADLAVFHLTLLRVIDSFSDTIPRNAKLSARSIVLRLLSGETGRSIAGGEFNRGGYDRIMRIRRELLRKLLQAFWL